MSSGRVCHFKLVLLGDTAVGKSCLVVRFVRDEFFEYQEPTIGGKGRRGRERRGAEAARSLPASRHLAIASLWSLAAVACPNTDTST